jgi:O-antigen/teichoic acid export membrane protein
LSRSLSYQVGILTLGRFVSFVALFFASIVNVRTLSQADYGSYRQFWLLYDTVTVALFVSFPSSLLYYFPRAENKAEKSVYLTQTLVFLFVMGLMSWGVYWVLRLVLHGSLGDAARQYTWAFCLFTLFMMITRMLERLFVAEKRPGAQAVWIAVIFSAQALVVVGASWLSHSVGVIIQALVVYAFVNAVFTVGYSVYAYKPSLRACSYATFKEQASYAVPLGLASIVLLVFGQTDKYVITYFLGKETFAIYSVGAMQLPLVDMLRNSVMNIVFPLMAEHQKRDQLPEILGLWRRATLKLAILFFPIFVFLEVSAKPFITILFTEKYVTATVIFMIYLLVFLRSTLDTTTVLMVFKENGFMFKVNVVAFAVHVVFAVSMYKKYGWLGVPCATVIMVYLQNGVFLWKSARLLKESLLTVMPWGALVLRLLTALALGACLYVVYRVRPVGNFFELAVAGVLYLLVYFGLCLVFRFAKISDVTSALAGAKR